MPRSVIIVYKHSDARREKEGVCFGKEKAY
jgi:hypothetical protein